MNQLTDIISRVQKMRDETLLTCGDMRLTVMVQSERWGVTKELALLK